MQFNAMSVRGAFVQVFNGEVCAALDKKGMDKSMFNVASTVGGAASCGITHTTVPP